MSSLGHKLSCTCPVNGQGMSSSLLDIHWTSTGHPLDIVQSMSSEVQRPNDTGHPLDIDWIPTGHLGIIKFTLSKVKYEGEHLADTCT